MSKWKSKKEKKEHFNDMQDWQEWQDNMYNPGHYVGTGKTPYPLKQLARNSRLKKLYLLYLAVPLVFSLLFMDFDWYIVLPWLLVLIAFILIIWDSKRTMKKRKG